MIPAADAEVDAPTIRRRPPSPHQGHTLNCSYTAVVVVGRETELQRVAELLAGARLRRGGALLVTGEAGVGKSTLLDEVATMSTGALVVRVVGTPAEQEVPYAALGLVLGDVTDELAALPVPQARALGVALALRDGDPPPPFAVGAATLAVLTRRAERAPLVVLLDDAHLLDQPSARALAFAARRLGADPVLVVAARRTGEGGPLAEAGLPELPVDGLDAGQVGSLMAELGLPATPEAAARAQAVTAGNPLAVTELVRRPDALARLALDDPIPLSGTLVDVFAERARALGPDVQVVVALSALAGGSAALVVAAASELGVDGTALGRAEQAGLVDLDGDRLAPRHPLVGSAVYSSLPAEQRRRLHAAVADALPPGRTDERARHLAAAAAGPDEGLAAALEEVAAAAARRGAPAVAAAGLERAAGITPAPSRRVERLLGAAEAAWAAGDAAWATRLCDEVVRDWPGPVPPWRAEALAGSIAARAGSLDVARRFLLRAADAAVADDPEAASRIVAEVVTLAFTLADAGTAATAARYATVLLGHDLGGAARGRCLMTTGMAAVLGGGSGEAELRAALALLRMPGAHPPLGDSTARDPHDDEDEVWALNTMLWLRGSEAADELAREIEARRATWAVGPLPRLLFFLARAGATRDHWGPARSAYAESTELAAELGLVTEQAMSLAGLAWLEARTGAVDDCARHAEQALALATPRSNVLAEVWAGFAQGESALAAGAVEEAAERFTLLSALLDRTGFVDVDVHPGPELAECLVLAGRADEAAVVADEYAARAHAKGRPWALARAARAQALLVDPAGIDAAFGEAARQHALTADLFEAARSRLLHGQRLRRSRRRADAREPLRDALEAFERLGAVPWADRAADELDATGATVVRRGTSALDALSPRERQIVALVSDGLTTREAALRLFLSPKTVEYHLRNVYARLGITSRPELVALVQRER
jgi:DNA-binding CsgD family transcriptional regulator